MGVGKTALITILMDKEPELTIASDYEAVVFVVRLDKVLTEEYYLHFWAKSPSVPVVVALEAAANGQAVRKAAAEWGVPRMTLFNRLHGDECRKDEFLLFRGSLRRRRISLLNGFSSRTPWASPTHSQIKQFAQCILAVRGDHVPLGKH
ncbi:hypothetical protein ACCO45_004475 [Purpureocillium lilacinum]|uniref:Uncharacterized protein n=1 Tax=Purpureocillium lilacinum TaxID=33203 RepID=A0ACC4E3U5_PURLI